MTRRALIKFLSVTLAAFAVPIKIDDRTVIKEGDVVEVAHDIMATSDTGIRAGSRGTLTRAVHYCDNGTPLPLWRMTFDQKQVCPFIGFIQEYNPSYDKSTSLKLVRRA